MTILVITVVITLAVSAQCSLYEATLYSVRMGALEGAKSRGKRKHLARRMIDMKREIAVPISAILILNTLANTAGATLSGMYAHRELGAGMVPLFSILFTLLILFFGEIAPKTLGAVHWRVVWPLVVWPLSAMRVVLYPGVWVAQRFAALITGSRAAPLISEEEILGIIRLGAREGEISRWESEVLHNIIALEERTVREIMTPRRVVFALPAGMPISEATPDVVEKEFSRILVYEEEAENIIGYVTRADVFAASLRGQSDQPLSSVQRPVDLLSERGQLPDRADGVPEEAAAHRRGPGRVRRAGRGGDPGRFAGDHVGDRDRGRERSQPRPAGNGATPPATGRVIRQWEGRLHAGRGRKTPGRSMP